MKFKKKQVRRRISRTDADILASKNALCDRQNDIELPLSYYDHVSDILCGKPSRHIYD